MALSFPVWCIDVTMCGSAGAGGIRYLFKMLTVYNFVFQYFPILIAEVESSYYH